MAVRVLIVQTAFLGDVVLTLPLIERLQQHFPDVEVDMLTVPAHAAVLQQQPGIGRVIAYDKRGKQRGIGGFLAVGRQIQARRYDVVLAPHRSLRTALLVAWSRSPRRIGFARWWTRWAYTSTVPRPVKGHEVERNMHLLTALGVHGVSPAARLGLRVTEAARQKAAAYFTRGGIASEDVVVGLIPGSQWGTKRWPAEHFAALIDHLANTQALQCVLIGGPQDRPIAEVIRARCTVPVLDLIGQTTLQELPAYLERCTVVVSNDTGPMHIAAAVGRPIVALFGPTIPEMGFAPYGVPWEEVSVALACRPCHAHGPQHCPLSHWRCMMELSVERVAASVQRLLCRLPVPDEERA
jgi:lipopolysaccharide heptosyltransferase II